MLIIMSNVLRNSEGVENRILKKSVYNSLVKNSLDWMILYREYIIHYYNKHKKLPRPFNNYQSIEYVLKNTPFHIQLGMKKHLGTQKLSPIILEKIISDQNDRSVSDIESFLSVALYADIQGRDFPKYLRSLVKKVDDNIVRDYLFYKLMNYYYMRTRAGSTNEQMYLDLLVELRIRSQKGVKRIKETIIKTFEDGKRKFLLKNPE